MAMQINANPALFNAKTNLSTLDNGLNRSIQRLSSGLRINNQSLKATESRVTVFFNNPSSGSEGLVLSNLRQQAVAGEVTNPISGQNAASVIAKGGISPAPINEEVQTTANSPEEKGMASTALTDFASATAEITIVTLDDIRNKGIEMYGEEFGVWADKLGDDFLYAFNRSGDEFYQQFKTIFSNAESAGNAIYGILKAFGGASGIDQATYVENLAMSYVETFTEGAAKHGKSFIEEMVRYGFQFLSDYKTYGDNYFSKVYEYGRDYFTGVKALGKDFFDMVEEGGREVVKRLGKLIDTIGEATEDVGAVLKEFGKDVLNAIEKGGEAFTDLLGIMDKGLKSIVDFMGKNIEDFKEALSDAVNGIADFGKNVWDKITGLF